MKLEPLQDYIAANTDLTAGVDLFVYERPAQAEPAVLMVLDDSGGRVDHEIPGRYKQRFQVIVSDPDYVRGMARAYELHALIPSEVTTDWTAYCTSYIRARHLPVHYRRSTGDVVEWSLNFDVLLFTP